MSPNKTVIAICGPTAAGKTDIAIAMAKKFGTDIISSDSRQCFRELNIGVAKPSAEQLQEVRHYFINSYSIVENVDAAIFERDALIASGEIFSKQDTLILAGGTGLYVRAFLEGLDDIPKISKEVRQEVRMGFQQHGLAWLRACLESSDPLFSEKGEMHNPHRMMRALEVFRSTGRSILDFHRAGENERNFTVRKIFLNPPRGILYERINSRVDKMMESGLLQEVESLVPLRNMNALQTVGYRELFDYLDGRISLEEAVDLIKRNTRRYAKRQLTWLRKYYVDDNTEMIE